MNTHITQKTATGTQDIPGILTAGHPLEGTQLGLLHTQTVSGDSWCGVGVVRTHHAVADARGFERTVVSILLELALLPRGHTGRACESERERDRERRGKLERGRRVHRQTRN